MEVDSGVLGNTLLWSVLDHYVSMGHHYQAKKGAPGDIKTPSAPAFDGPALKEMFAYSCAAWGTGLTRTQVQVLHGVLRALDLWAGGANSISGPRFKQVRVLQSHPPRKEEDLGTPRVV